MLGGSIGKNGLLLTRLVGIELRRDRAELEGLGDAGPARRRLGREEAVQAARIGAVTDAAKDIDVAVDEAPELAVAGLDHRPLLEGLEGESGAHRKARG